jgi:chemotaxis protein MotB
MLTLLLAFFIIMYSISKADAQRFKKFQAGMQQAFHVTVLQGSDATSFESGSLAVAGLDSSTALGPAPLSAAPPPLSVPTIANSSASHLAPLTVDTEVRLPSEPAAASSAATTPATVSMAPVVSPNQTSPHDEEVVMQLGVAFEGLVPPGSRGNIQVQTRPDGIVISIQGVILFDSGAADLQSDSRTILGQVADRIRPLPYNIRVEGNTDGIPLDGGPFPSNWELSTARALAVTHFLIDQGHVDPRRLSATGYGEFRPIASNDTRDGRLRNRRIDLVLTRPDPAPRGTP